MTIEIDKLIVTQFSLRHHDQIPGMVQFVKNGGFWNQHSLENYAKLNSLKVSPLISISLFEDNKMYIHDGHHRISSVYLGGRNFLRQDEYRIHRWLYKDYLEINISNNWITPFDPRIEGRVADLSVFKKNVEKSIDKINYIINNKNIYLVPRQFNHIKDIFHVN